MRRPMLLLSLIAALSGTPLRISEAANDLARSFGVPAGEVEIELIDGGVGDDSDATIKAETSRDLFSESIEHVDLNVPWLVQIPPESTLQRSTLPTGPIATGWSARQAWLQRFRI